jgi:transposase
MPLTLSENSSVYVSLKPVDMRKSINGLSALVLSVFKKQPTSGHLFVFYNHSKDKVKILHWDRNGFFLYYKRLEKGKFQFKKTVDEVVELSSDQLSWLLAGLDFMLMNDFAELNYSNYY